MMDQHLDFEQPIYTCLEKIEELKKACLTPQNLSEQLNQLQIEAEKETAKIYKNLSPWQKVLVARHPNRPHTIDYIKMSLMDLRNCMVIDWATMIKLSLEAWHFLMNIQS